MKLASPANAHLAERMHPAVVFCYAGTVLLGSIAIILNATLVPLAGANHVDVVRAGWLISSLGIGRACVQSVCGMLADRYGRKPIALIGMALLLLFYVVMPFSESFWLSNCLCALFGVGYGMLNTSSLSVLYDYYAPRGRNAVAQSYVQLMFASGGVVIPFVANRLLEGGLYWGWLYWSCGIFTVFMIILAAASPFPGPHARVPQQKSFAYAPRLLVEGLILCATVFSVYSMGIICTAWLPILAAERIGYTQTQAVLMLSLYSLGALCGTLVYARLLRRYHALFFIKANPLIAACMVTLCIFARTQWLFIVGVFMAGATIAIVFNMGVGVGGEIFGAKAATITGMLATSSAVSTLLVPVITGPVINAYGVRWAFAGVYFFCACGLSSAVWFGKRYRRMIG